MHYEITGGTPLGGRITLAGAKNLASKLILASLLPDGVSTIHGVPDIGETEIAVELIRAAGAAVTKTGDTLTIDATAVTPPDLGHLSSKSRLSILLLGPLLHRFGSAHVPPVTGDQIGRRPVGFHIDALRALGARIEQTADGFSAHADGLRGASISLPYPSVGATETILLTATWATGTTILDNAAVEPEVLALADFLRAMGADIQVDQAIRRMTIQGVATLRGAEQTVLPDRLEAVSYASLALATGGSVLLTNAVASHLSSYLDFCARIGAAVTHGSDGIRFERQGELRATSIETAVHPGFMADWQQPSLIVLLAARGESYVHETVYEDRLRYTADLAAMGADVSVSTECYGTPCRFAGQGFRHSALVRGPSQLTAATLQIPDIRAGMAHVIAAFMATGTSFLHGIEHLDRGYGASEFERKLRSLGADIARVED